MNPGVEHAVRNFLDWVDDELGNCAKLQKYCHQSWQQNFPFPRAILRNEIESVGYVSGDFCITMDQTKILELLTGENLYDNRDVFVRELLQNAIDATLLRGKMDSDFIPEKSRIDFWEWNDKNGNIWFRIDDEGTGMTMGMLQRYFLKVGNSYYSSKEIERDLRNHHQTEKYYGISRFGIGFLSCFLNGDYAEVSTLYFDSDKNRREEETTNSNFNKHYGLRLQVTGLSGYYTLLNQAQNHLASDQMPNPGSSDSETSYQQERNGYRKNAGTSIAIRLNPGKLGTLDLKNTVKKYLCGSRVPVYYNNERIGQTYDEIMKAAHDVEGEKIYELTDEMKKQFDQVFPELRGLYPKIAMTTIPLDTKEDGVLQGVSGVLVKYGIRFERTPCWQVKDLKFGIIGQFKEKNKEIQLILSSACMEGDGDDYVWENIIEEYDAKEVVALADAFESCDTCLKLEEQLGDEWRPFRTYANLYEVWQSYYEYKNRREMVVLIEKCGCPDIVHQKSNSRGELIRCAYQGVSVGALTGIHPSNYSCMGIFFLENKWQPVTQASRAKVTQLPIEVGLYICGVANKYKLLDLMENQYMWIGSVANFTQKDWKTFENLPLQQWMGKCMKDYFEERISFLKESALSKSYRGNIYIQYYSDRVLVNLYQDMCLQEHNRMEIDFEKGQSILFYERDQEELEAVMDLFPPMRFCKAANDESRSYLCGAELDYRKGITLDHPFMIWLMKNAVLMNKYYQRQFRQIIGCLRYSTATYIISEINAIREQLIRLPEHHGVDVDNFPQLSRDAFWYMEDESETSV